MRWSPWTNCTSPDSLCGTVDIVGLQGATGICNTASGECSCANGYSGTDFAARWNDCHIQAALDLLFTAAATVFTSSALLTSLAGVIILLRRWRVIRWEHEHGLVAAAAAEGQRDEATVFDDAAAAMARSPAVDGSGGGSTRGRRPSTLPTIDLAVLKAPSTNVRSTSYNKLVADYKRRRNTLWLLSNFALFSWAITVVQVTRHLGVRLEQVNGVQWFHIWATLTSLVWALYLSAYTWFCNLPSLRVFGAMFPQVASNLLIRYPSLVKYVAITNCVFTTVVMGVFCFAWPLADPERWDVWLTVGLSVFSGLVFGYMVVMCLVCSLLLNLFDTYRSATSKDRPATAQSQAAQPSKALAAATNTVRLIVILVPFATALAVPLLLAMVWSSGGRRIWFILFSVLVIIGAAAVHIFTWVFVVRMSPQADTAGGNAAAPPGSPATPNPGAVGGGRVVAASSSISPPM